MAKVTIEGKEYDTDELPEDARDNILNIRFCDSKAADLRRELAMVQTARNAYAAVLQGQLPKDA